MNPRRIMGEEDIRKIVEQTVEQTLQNLGFTPENPQEVQADQIYLRKAREGSDEISKWMKRSILGIAFSAAAYALWEGVKRLVGE